MNRGTHNGHQSGLTLVELLVAMLLTALFLLGLVQLVTAAGSASLLQDERASLQDSTRYLAGLLEGTVSQAGFTPEPWNESFDRAAIAASTADQVDQSSDRLALREWSELNCFDNRNPDTDGAGRPRFYLRENVFDLNGSGYLSRTCRYGPSAANLVTQIRRQGLVPGIEAFQVLFGLDGDSDGSVDRWVRAGAWPDEAQVRGVRAGLLLAGAESARDSRPEWFRVLDTPPVEHDDGRIRQALELSMAIRGRRQ